MEETPPKRVEGRTFEFAFALPNRRNAGDESKTKAIRNTTPTADRKPEGRKGRKDSRTYWDRAEQHRSYAANWRAEHKASGLCVNCSNPAVEGQTRCPTCAEKHHDSNMRRRAKRKDMG